MGPAVFVASHEGIEPLGNQHGADGDVHQVHLLLLLEFPEPLSQFLDPHEVQDVLQVHAAAEPGLEGLEEGAPLLFEEDVHAGL